MGTETIISRGRIILAVAILCGALGACQVANPPPISSATQYDVATIARDAAGIQSACSEALPLAMLANAIPVIGSGVAAGVQVGCNTDAGIVKLTSDPTSAQWLGEQIQILKQALGKA